MHSLLARARTHRPLHQRNSLAFVSVENTGSVTIFGRATDKETLKREIRILSTPSLDPSPDK